MTNSNLALLISIAGTIAGPLITAAINNHHEAALKRLDIQQQMSAEYNQKRSDAVTAFLSSVGETLATTGMKLGGAGKSFFAVYQYVSPDDYPKLDDLYNALKENDYKKAQPLFMDVSKLLSNLIREEPPKSPSL